MNFWSQLTEHKNLHYLSSPIFPMLHNRNILNVLSILLIYFPSFLFCYVTHETELQSYNKWPF